VVAVLVAVASAVAVAVVAARAALAKMTEDRGRETDKIFDPVLGLRSVNDEL
jgi:hypothetical protein